jgi:hypothetical protein
MVSIGYEALVETCKGGGCVWVSLVCMHACMYVYM